MNSRAGEAQPKQLLDQTISHCRKLSVAKKERLELIDACTDLGGRLNNRPLPPKQANDLMSKLVEVEERLGVWSNYNFFKGLIKRGTIKASIRVFIENLKSISSGSSAIPSAPEIITPESKGVEVTPPPEEVDNANAVDVTSHNDREPLPHETAKHEAPVNHPVGAGQPPTVKLLNGMVTRQGENPLAEGRFCRVWEGQLNNSGGENGSGEEIGRGGAGTKKVALKALRPRPPQGRLGKAQKAKETERAERAREELMSELLRWAELRHPNVLPFYGIVTNIGTRLYMVFPWRENGNLLTYVKDHPQVDKNRLLRDSAAGLSYLHSKVIVHGNVRCNNVFITHKGEPQICDFGIAKAFHKSGESEDTVSHTRSPAADVRYAAPELIEHNDFRATTSSDTYSFALLILEFITQAPPFSNLRHEADIIHERIEKKMCPSRPNGELHIQDSLWALMGRCWTLEPEPRPTMKAVHQFFCHID